MIKRSELAKKWKSSVRQLIAILIFGLIILALSTGQRVWRHEAVSWFEVVKTSALWLAAGGALYLFGLMITSIIAQGCKED